MSNKNKLQRFAEIARLPNVFENFDFHDPHINDIQGNRMDIKGNWNKLVFQKEKPIVLELACGKGEYTTHLAQANPENNYIGIDIKGARIWKGATLADQAGLTNVAFLRTRIELIQSFFKKGEVSEIWITFPDPFLRDSKSNRRLTSHPFLDRYTDVLKPGAILHLKTDDPTLYAFTLKVLSERKDYRILESTDDFYGAVVPTPETHLLTFYETQHLAAGKKITYIRFTLNG
ncbi:MAG: tRNA (guanosine(46)-N7)-methyltransferase TrmB [Saprospiraceae bacterium]|nr:tRNA (guanosine(46)-N7)-methyltransferase TrmB [Saprospiraceae bacterium]